jgi:hypothetical protein
MIGKLYRCKWGTVADNGVPNSKEGELVLLVEEQKTVPLDGTSWFLMLRSDGRVVRFTSDRAWFRDGFKMLTSSSSSSSSSS